MEGGTGSHKIRSAIFISFALFGFKLTTAATCNMDPNAGTNRCDGMKCKFDWQCFSGYCYDDKTIGKDSCSKFNNCASTIFSHYGRCDGIECDTSSNCFSIGCVENLC